MREQVKCFRDVFLKKGLSVPPSPYCVSEESVEMVGETFQHLLEKPCIPTLSLSPTEVPCQGCP